MNKRMIASLFASALLIGSGTAIASASDASAATDAKAAADAARAGEALTRHDARAAIAAAEKAVTLAPRQAAYRVLLGRSYIAAGRFVSARDAFADALALSPADGPLTGKAALNLVLAQIATGDLGAARRNLDEHSAAIAPADRGLALALAGDPNGAVQLLTQVARSPDTTPKVRQNLALSLALAGQWQAARAVAAFDVSPADLDARLEQWAAFARPHAAADQVATLLGVTPVADSGQPTRLALTAEPSVVAAAAASALPQTVSAPVDAKQVAVAVAAAPALQPGFVAASRIVFGPRAEVVQPLPVARHDDVAAARTLRAHRKPFKVALADHPAPKAPAVPAAKGSWFVQLGAFGSSAVARDAWGRMAHRLPALAARGPSGSNFTINKTTFYRLSSGGFSRGEADTLCRRYKGIGGHCFVRAAAGDQVASWACKDLQVAAK